MVIAFSAIHAVAEFQSVVVNVKLGKAVKISGCVLFVDTDGRCAVRRRQDEEEP
jgi:hypothetical protein